MKKAPVTILTGFLGSGKTTLLNELLQRSPNKKVAVIENEFGTEVGIESLIADARTGEVFEEVFELGNGCICCSVKGELQRVLDNIMAREEKYDHIVVETTGLANPGPVASMFWCDEQLESKYYLDAIVTVIDAKNFETHWRDDERAEDALNEADRQLAFADVLVINKVDLVDETQVLRLRELLAETNSLAKVIVSERCQIDPVEYVGIDAYSALDPEHAPAERVAALVSSANESGGHDQSVTTVSVVAPGDVDQLLLERWIGSHVWTDSNARDWFRFKAVLSVRGSEYKHVLQGVHELFEVTPSTEQWSDGEKRLNRLVFIGRNLDRERLLEEFKEVAEASAKVVDEDN